MQAGCLPAEDAAELTTAYCFLRLAENRLQALHDRQTHDIPADSSDQQRLAFAMGMASWEEFLAALDVQRDRVAFHFHEIVFRGANGAGSSSTFENDAATGTPSSVLDEVWNDEAALEQQEVLLAEAGFGDPAGIAEQLRRLREVDDKHHLTLLCRDLSELARFARVDNRQFRLLKQGTPGPYTFILEATKEVPRRLSHPSRRTIGLRVPDHPVTQALLAAFGEPLLATTLIAPGETEPMNDAHEIRGYFGKRLQAVVDAGACPMEPTTVVDLTADEPVLLRQGRGDPARLGLA